MKKMRFALSFILCIIIVLSCSFSAFSAEYTLSDLGMSVDIPDTMTVITRSDLSTADSTCYLQATTQDASLKISIFMVPTDKNAEIQTFEGLSNSALNEIKYKIEYEGFSAGTIGNYGSVPFLDFSRKDTDAAGVDTFIKQSITVINSKQISIISESSGDNFTSDELELIKGCLQSIEFESIVKEEVAQKKSNVRKWLIAIFLIGILTFLGVFYGLKYKRIKDRKELLKAQQKDSNYDVLKRADAKRNAASQNQIGGYKSSTDYFDKAFFEKSEEAQSPFVQCESPATGNKQKPTALKRMGYFAKNLKREVKKNKARKSTGKGKRKAVDYDIFNEK